MSCGSNKRTKEKVRLLPNSANLHRHKKTITDIRLPGLLNHGEQRRKRDTRDTEKRYSQQKKTFPMLEVENTTHKGLLAR